MICEKCGNVMRETAKFCGKCGSEKKKMSHDSEVLAKEIEQVEQSKEVERVEQPEQAEQSEQLEQPREVEQPVEFTLIGVKRFGRAKLKKIITNVSIEKNWMTYCQDLTLFHWIKKSVDQTSHNIDEFTTVKCARTFDVSYTCAAIFVLWASFKLHDASYALPALLLFWIGLGTKIKITKSNGAMISIMGHRRDCEALQKEIVKRNNSLVIKA